MDKLEIVDLDEHPELNLIDARKLHAVLKVKGDFLTWINGYIEECGFVRSKDFFIGLGAHYILTEQMAKQIIIMDRNSVEYTSIDALLIKILFCYKEQRVSARLLHLLLGVKTCFRGWIAYRIKQLGFIEGKDFHVSLGESTGGRPEKDYLLAKDVAKELAMIEKTRVGRQVMEYFLESIADCPAATTYIMEFASGSVGRVRA